MSIHERERPAVSPTLGAVGLRVNGKEYRGWKTAQITRGIESISGSFELSVSERWATQAEPWPIRQEDECTLVIGSKKVITGWVDRRSPSYNASSHALSVSGRDASAALVDCSANPELGAWEFKGVSVLTFCKRICQPFGISVSLQSGLTDEALPKPPKKLSIDPGDTAVNAIESACRLAALLPVSDGLGGLVLTRAGAATRATTELVEGQNILSASAEFNAAERFHTYKVLGQHKGNNAFNGVSASSVKGTAVDLNVLRSTRVLIIRPEGNTTVEHAKKRAEWEATHRAARAMAVTVTVQGWTQGDGVLWPINSLVRVRSPKLGVDGDMLITEVTYSASADAGTTTALSLKRPDSFQPEPVIAAGSDGTWVEIRRGV